MKLELIEQPNEEIITLQEVKDYLNINHNFEDSMLKLLIKSTREAIETLVQKSIIKQTWKYTLSQNEFDNLNTDGRPCVFGSMIKIPMPRPPVLDIVEVVIDRKVIDRKRLKLEKINNTSYLYVNNIRNFDKCQEISILYNAGIALFPNRVPYQIKLANLMLVANAYQDRYNSTYQISAGIRELLSPFLNLRIF